MSGRSGSSSMHALLRRQPRSRRVTTLVQLLDQRLADRAPHLRWEERRRPRAGADHRARPCVPAPPSRTNGRELSDGTVDSCASATPRNSDTRSSVPGRAPRRGRGSAAAGPARAGSGRRGPPAAGRTCPAAGSARTAPSPSSIALRARGACLDDVGARLEPVDPQVHPVRVRPVDRVAQHRDQLGLRQVRGDPAPRVPVVEVERRALPAQRPVRCLGEQRRGSAPAATSTPGCCGRRRDPCTPAAGESPHM